MSRVVFMVSVSLDGFFEGPDADIGWHRVDEELHAHFNEYLATVGAFVEGRVTYELMEGHWPTADEAPDAAPVEVEFARIWREKPKVVYSRTLESAGPGARIVRDVVPEEVEALKAEMGGDLGLGGAVLLASFLEHDLVDEIRIYVHPVVIGAGRRPFPPDVWLDLELVETKAFGNGVVLLRYERLRSTRSEPTALTSS